jgi:hypothetical protein
MGKWTMWKTRQRRYQINNTIILFTELIFMSFQKITEQTKCREVKWKLRIPLYMWHGIACGTNRDHIHALPIICLNVYLVCSDDWITHYTHYRKTVALHYICINDSSDEPDHRTIYLLHVTGKWSLPSVCACWCLHISVQSEWFIIHYRIVVAPHYVYTDASSYHPSDWIIYYTNCRKMAAPQYACVDVSSDEAADWMIYYTYYRKMGAPQYVRVDVSS